MKDRQGERKYRKTVRKIIEMKPSKKEKGGTKREWTRITLLPYGKEQGKEGGIESLRWNQ